MNRLASASIQRLPRHWNRSLAHLSNSPHSALFSTTVSDQPTSLSALRNSILKSSLEEVHQWGWTDEALAAGAASVRGKHPKVSMSVVGLMTVDDLIGYCMDQWNRDLKEELTNPKPPNSQEVVVGMVDDPLQKAIQIRLGYLIPYLQSHRWHEGMALGIRGPSNAWQTQQQLKEMVDIIVASSPEHRSMGTPERMALGAVYVATELHLLTDPSPGYQDTWKFLSLRMDDWRRWTGGGSGDSKVGDALFVATSVVSSLVGGLLSLVANPTTKGGGMFGLPTQVMAALFPTPSWEATTTNRPAGTHPDDYQVPKKPSGATGSHK